MTKLVELMNMFSNIYCNFHTSTNVHEQPIMYQLRTIPHFRNKARHKSVPTVWILGTAEHPLLTKNSVTEAAIDVP